MCHCTVRLSNLRGFRQEQIYTLGVFIDLSEAFDTVDHSMLLRKLELYGIIDRNYAWVKNYLSNRLQYKFPEYQGIIDFRDDKRRKTTKDDILLMPHICLYEVNIS